jgi:hypothetical protein
MMEAQEASRLVSRSSAQRLRRLVNEMRVRFPDVPRNEPIPPLREFSKVSQHPAAELAAFRASVSRLADQIQDEDRARLLEPTGPKILCGRNPIRRPQTAIISIAAQAAYERRMAREKFMAAMNSLARRA